MIVACVVVTTPALVVCLCRPYTRRRAPLLTLPEGSTLELLQDNRLEDPKQRDALKQAFLPGPDTRWITTGGTHQDSKKDRPKGTVSTAARIKSTTDYMIELQLRFAEKHGYVCVARDPTTNAFQGLIALIPPIYSNRKKNPKWRKNLQYRACAVSLERPNLNKAGKARWKAFRKTAEKLEDGVEGPYWYVAVLGVVDPAKGVGRRLLEETYTITGSEHPILLQCHADNVGFYEKMGFLRHDEMEVGPVKGSEKFTYYSMLRQAGTA